MKTREIAREEWKKFFDNLSRKQEGWEATLEVFGPEIGDQIEERHMFLTGTTAELGDDLEWRSVLAFGNYEEVANPVERSDILNKLLQRFPMLTPVESAIAHDAGYPTVIVYRIRIDRITGVSED